MMEAVGLVDPALVEQAAGPARRHSARRPLRTGLIAACLCAALLGSAWAANQIGGFRSLKFFEDLLLPAELSDDGEALGEAHYDGYTPVSYTHLAGPRCHRGRGGRRSG